MLDGIEIVDAQVHAWKSLGTPHWPSTYQGANQEVFSLEMALAAMEAVGVDAAILDVLGETGTGTWDDNSYGEEAAQRWPERFGSVVRGVKHKADDVEDRVANLRSQPGVLGIRISPASDEQERAILDGEYERLFSAAEAHDVPVLAYISGRLNLIEKMARDHPDLSILIVHLGLPQPPRELDDPPFLRLPQLLDLAQYENVSIEVIGVPAFSRESYPFADVRPSLDKLFDAFTMDRLMWGSDFTRLWGRHTYAELLTYMFYLDGLSRNEKEKLFGGTLRRILRWPARTTAPVQ